MQHLETYMKGSLHTPLHDATPLALTKLGLGQYKHRRMKSFYHETRLKCFASNLVVFQHPSRANVFTGYYWFTLFNLQLE